MLQLMGYFVAQIDPLPGFALDHTRDSIQWHSQDSELGRGLESLFFSFPLPSPSLFSSASLPLPPLRSRPLKYS